MSENQEQIQLVKERASALFLDNIGLVKMLAWRKAPEANLVDDIVHDAFLNFVENAARWDLSCDIRPLLRRITSNVAGRAWRDRKKNLPETLGRIYMLLQRSEEVQDSDEEQEIFEQMILALDLCKKKLAPKYRALIEAYYYDGLKIAELARRHNVQPGAMKMMICRIRLALHTCIEKMNKQGELNVE